MAVDPVLKAQQLADQIKKEVEGAAGAGLKAAVEFFKARLIETISVSALPKRARSKTGEIYYRAGEPATPGAPIRKLSGDTVKKTTSAMVSELEGVIGVASRSPNNFRYPEYWEIVDPGKPGSGKHQFIAPTVAKYSGDMAKIVGENVKLVIQGGQ